MILEDAEGEREAPEEGFEGESGEEEGPGWAAVVGGRERGCGAYGGNLFCVGAVVVIRWVNRVVFPRSKLL